MNGEKDFEDHHPSRHHDLCSETEEQKLGKLEVANKGISSTDKYYADHAQEYASRTDIADMSELHDRFLSRMPFGGSILDAGCGSGRDLRAFAQRGYRAFGIDASARLIEIAKSHSDASCAVGRIEEITDVGTFDGIWACASLLHFRKTQLNAVLQKLRKALVPGGVLFAAVQHGEGEREIPDGRFFAYYQMPEFIAALEAAGFTISESWLTEDSLRRNTAGNWINVLATA